MQIRYDYVLNNKYTILEKTLAEREVVEENKLSILQRILKSVRIVHLICGQPMLL